MKHYDRCHVYVASVTDLLPLVLLLSPVLAPIICFNTSFLFLIFHSLFINRLLCCTLPASPPLSLTVCMCVFFSLLAAERRALHNDTAGRDAARHRCRHEVSVRHELCSPRPRRPKYPGQQQLGLQGFRLWPVALSGRHLR